MLAILLTASLLLATATAPPKTVIVQLTASADAVRIQGQDLPLERAEETLREQEGAPVTVLQEGEGGDLPARAALRVIDRLLRAGRPVRAKLPRATARLETLQLDLEDWTAGAPWVEDICQAGELPGEFAVAGRTALLGVDLRGAASLSRSEGRPVLACHPVRLLSRTLPGAAGPSAALALGLEESATVHDLFLALRIAADQGFGRVLLLLRRGSKKHPEDAGLLLSLDAQSDLGTTLPHRKAPPSKKGRPADRAVRLLAEEALLALRLEVRADGSLRGDDDFGDGASTALALMAFLGAGVRAGDGTPSGAAVAQMENWLLAWPPDSNQRIPRMERTIVAAAMIEAYWRTRHPGLRGRAQAGLREILEELGTDSEFRDGIEKGFEAIGVARALECDLEGAGRAQDHLDRLLSQAIDPETGEIVAEYSTRSSADFIALANALTLLGSDPASDPRIQFLSRQGAAELPSTDSTLSNPKRPLAAFFHGRFAQNAGGEAFDRFSEMLAASLPKAPPKKDYDIEELRPDKVRSPWSGGGALQSAGKVALMALAYEVPDQMALRRRSQSGGRRER